MKTRGVMVVVSLFGLACFEPPAGPWVTARDTDAAFQTEHLGYYVESSSLAYHVTFNVTYTNNGAEPIGFTGCVHGGNFVLQKLVDGEFRTIWGPDIDLCLSEPPTVVLPGRSLTLMAWFLGIHADLRGHTRFSADEIPGIYRLVWNDMIRANEVGQSLGGLPVESRISNRFSLLALHPTS